LAQRQLCLGGGSATPIFIETIAVDLFTVVTAMFKVLYVFVVVEHATRRILHFNVTEHPTADWTLQQLREAIPADRSYRLDSRSGRQGLPPTR
jgi:hypothetical protein